MASATFPGAPEYYSFDRPHGVGSSADSIATDDDGFELAEDIHSSLTASHFGAPGGFAINPLSVRTPRVSIFGSSVSPTAASSSGFAPMSAASIASLTPRPLPVDAQSQGDLMILEEDLDSEVDIRTGIVPQKPVVRTEDVWREIVKSSTGRDKALKLIQYSLKLCALFHSSVAVSTVLRRQRRGPRLGAELMVGVNSTVSGLSLARKCLILFNWLAPLSQITQPQPVDTFTEMQNKFGKQAVLKPQQPLLHKFLHAPPPVLLDLLNGVADDVSTFSKLGIVNKNLGGRAGKLADWCWFAATIVNLVELQVERGILTGMMQEMQSRLYNESMAGPGKKSEGTKVDETELEKLRKQDYWIQISRTKLLFDLIFVSYEVFELKRAADSVKTVTGLLSGVLSTYKLYDTHTRALLKA